MKALYLLSIVQFISCEKPYDESDVLSKLAGDYTLKATRFCRSLIPQYCCDTMFQSLATISRVGDSIFIEEKDHILQYFYTLLETTEDTSISYLATGIEGTYGGYSSGNHSILTYFLDSDSIKISKHDHIGIGLQMIHEFDGIKIK